MQMFGWQGSHLRLLRALLHVRTHPTLPLRGRGRADGREHEASPFVGVPDTISGMEEMTEAYAIRAGGWDARYAVVRAMTIRNDIAAVLVDPNGDGGSIDLDEYRRGPDGTWEAGNSGGSAGDSGTSWSPWMVATYGRTEPEATVLVDYNGETHTLVADGEGWWLFATESVDEDTMPGSRSAH